MNIIRELNKQYTNTLNNNNKNRKYNKYSKTTTTVKNTKFKHLKCSPLSKNKSIANTCYNNEMINELVTNWNKNYTHDKINIHSNINSKYNQLSTKLSSKCDNELCWAKTLIKKDIDHYLELFAPYSPSSWINNPTEWLSNIEINQILKQYEKCDTQFKFVGTTPIDFDTNLGNVCVTPALCNFTLSKYIKKGKNKLGIIFNTDKHDQSGSHWISVFINIPKKLIFFFDSAGNKCPKLIVNLVNRIIDQGIKLNINFTFDQNYPIRHQSGTTECGMYCLFFIINMIKDTVPIEYFKTKRIPDEYMIKYRNILFNKSS
jgi:hypothetical protein